MDATWWVKRVLFFIQLLLLLQITGGSDLDAAFCSRRDALFLPQTCPLRSLGHVPQPLCSLPTPCSPPRDLGPFQVNFTVTSLQEEAKLLPEVTSGGSWRPRCHTRQRIAILIPFKNREGDLNILLPNLHAFLQLQNLIEYRIFVINQVGDQHFNKGHVFNAGVLEVEQLDPDYDCLILHDVDKIPEDSRNLYTCDSAPKVLLTKKRFQSELLHKPYAHRPYFGGVVALSADLYHRVNGFSNRFWGWGSEDDDFRDRVVYNGLDPVTSQDDVGVYAEIWHAWGFVNPRRHDVRQEGKGSYTDDGLTSSNYKMTSLIEHELYTQISIQILDSDPYKERS